MIFFSFIYGIMFEKKSIESQIEKKRKVISHLHRLVTKEYDK